MKVPIFGETYFFQNLRHPPLPQKVVLGKEIDPQKLVSGKEIDPQNMVTEKKLVLNIG